MQATVTNIKENGRIELSVRRSENAALYSAKFGDNADLKVGDKIQVKRVTNNPYLVRVK